MVPQLPQQVPGAHLKIIIHTVQLVLPFAIAIPRSPSRAPLPSRRLRNDAGPDLVRPEFVHLRHLDGRKHSIVEAVLVDPVAKEDPKLLVTHEAPENTVRHVFPEHVGVGILQADIGIPAEELPTARRRT